MDCRIAGGRGLEVTLDEALHGRRLQPLHQLFIAAYRHPASVPELCIHTLTVAVADCHAAALGPVFLVTAAKINLISP